MEIESQLYWILLETELDDPGLYFPPDTPVGKTNPKRHYAILKKRHIRQRERLINLQKHELEEYQKKFSVEHREDLFIKPTITACEPVKGSDFLAKNSDAISELLTSIPNLIIENQSQATKPKEKKLSNAKREEFLETIKKKFDAGFEAINKKHQLQLDALLSLQKDDLTVIPREYHDPPPYAAIKRDHHMSPSSPPQHSPTRKRTAEYEERLHKKKKSTTTKYDSSEMKDSSKHKSTSSPQDRKPTIPASQQYSGGRPPFIAPFTWQAPIRNGNSLAVGTSKQLGVPFGPRAQTVGIPSNGRPPTVSTAAKIDTPSSKQPQSVGLSPSSKNNRRESLPLFSNKPIHHHVVSLLDKGTLLIQNKPNRVIIRGPNGVSTNYGDPKDYDDAINSSVERPDNPVYKRHTQGQDFLFYKNSSGKVVTIGPVSKIQPLIHKFFLSM